MRSPKSSLVGSAGRRARSLASGQRALPDVRSAEFRSEAHRQSLVAAGSAEEAADQAFIDAISAPNLDEA